MNRLNNKETKWTYLENNASCDVVSALKKLNTYYDGKSFAKWLSTLWDPEIGGFYFSDSARDTEGYLPDLESTYQLLYTMQVNGAFADYDNSFVKAIPKDIREKIVRFAKNMQSPEDGYYYHPQWKDMNLTTDRIGRDLMWGRRIITEFGDVPLWDSPDGTRGTNGAPSGKRIPVQNSAAAEKPRKVSVDFATSEEYVKWLTEFNSTIKHNSGRAHEMNALYPEIKGKGFVRETLDFLDRIQDEVYAEQTAAGETPTGLWQKPINYHSSWSVLKYSAFYNDPQCGREIRYAKDIVKTCIKVIALPPEGNYRMHDLYNQWSSINVLIDNVKKYHPENLGEIFETVRASAPELIDNSIGKIAPFKLSNGLFVYTPERKALAIMYGMPTSLGVEEADVNCNSLCCSMYRCIFYALGYPVVPLLDPEDGREFLKTISSASPIKKNKAPKQ